MICKDGVCKLDKKGVVIEKAPLVQESGTESVVGVMGVIEGTKKEQHRMKLVREFQTQLIRFMDELIEQFPAVSDFVIYRIFLENQISPFDLIGKFIRDLLPLKEKVDLRDEKFFIENTFIYTKGQVNDNKVDFFTKLWMSGDLDEQDRDVIWKWMDVFLQIAGKYKTLFGYVDTWEPVVKN